MVMISLEARRFGCKMTVNLSFLSISSCFMFHSTVSFFSKLVIPVHVSMEEPVFKTKMDSKSTSVKVLMDGKETTATKQFLQVPTSINKPT